MEPVSLLHFAVRRTVQTTPRTEAKRAFVLADRLKGTPFDSMEIFQRCFAAEHSKVQELSDADLDRIIARDPKRLENYDKAAWRLGRIVLATCSVYPRMGGREWAIGSVRDVAGKFERLEPSAGRIWMMKVFCGVFEAQLPILILILKERTRFDIDDGSHRAIAMALSGVEMVDAWIGEL